MAKQHLEALSNILDEQDKNDPLDDSANVCDFVERDAASELLFDMMLETTNLLDADVLWRLWRVKRFQRQAMEELVCHKSRSVMILRSGGI